MTDKETFMGKHLLPGFLVLGLLIGGESTARAADLVLAVTTGEALVGTSRRFTLTVSNSSTAATHTIRDVRIGDPSDPGGAGGVRRFAACLPAASPCVAPAAWGTLGPAPVAGTTTQLQLEIEFSPSQVGANPGVGGAATVSVSSDLESIETGLTGVGTAVDLALLVDNSGSMSLRPDGSFTSNPSERRIEAARGAVHSVLQRLNNLIPAAPPFPPQINVALCLFNFGNSSRSTSCPVVLAPFNLTGLQAAVNAIVASGGTPMGRGLVSAIDTLQPAGVQEPFRKQAILMLSNGAHNTDPCPNGTATFPCPDGKLTRKGIKLYAIGYGTEGDVQPGQLKRLVEDSGNGLGVGLRHFVPVSASCPGNLPPGVTCLEDTPKNLELFLLGVLHALELVESPVDPRSTIRLGETKEHDVDITELDRAADFNLSWEATPPSAPLRFELVAPDGTVINRGSPSQEITFGVGPSYLYYLVGKKSLRGNVGRWKIRVSYGPGGDDGGGGPDLRASRRRPPRASAPASTSARATISARASALDFTYSYGVTVPSDLRMIVRFDRDAYRTGEPMLITATVQASGVALRGSQIDSISAGQERPGDGVGNWYAAHQPTAQQLATVPPAAAADPFGPLQTKSRALRFAAGTALPFRTVHPPLAFKDDGVAPDAEADDGIFSALYTDTGKPDTHSFYLRAVGKTRAGTRFTREALFQQFVPASVVPDPATSPLSFQVLTGADRGMTRVRVGVIPRDRFANHLGPGFIPDISFSASSGTWIGPVEDDLKGGYSRVLEYRTATQNPVVTVTVQDQDFPDQDVKQRSRPRLEMGLFGGGFFFSRDLPITRGPVFGVRVAVPIPFGLQVEAEAGTTITSDRTGARGRVLQLVGSLRWDLHALAFGPFTPFLTGGSGWLDFSGFQASDSSALLQLGGGLTAQLRPRMWLRLDAREMFGLDTYGRTSNNLQAAAHLAIGF
jgi:hypothetical protein